MKYRINQDFHPFQRPRPQSEAGHDKQGSEAEEEKREGESEAKGAKSDKDIDQEKIEEKENKNVNIKKRNFKAKVQPRVIKTLIKEISCGLICKIQNMHKPQSQPQNILEISKWKS